MHPVRSRRQPLSSNRDKRVVEHQVGYSMLEFVV
jgi:hypothetical protein